MRLSLFDLHCDTAYEMHARTQSLAKNSLAISLSHAARYDRYVQVMAIWTPPHLSDEEGWHALHRAYETLRSDPSVLCGDATLCTSLPEVLRVPTLLLSLEDARVLGGAIGRVRQIREMGVCTVAPLWRGVSSIGGAWDTAEGLTEFGHTAAREILCCGMLLDLSHASRRSAQELLALSEEAGRPVLASHSNAYAVTPVQRNLTDGEIRAILRTGGVIGLNLCVDFLRRTETAPASVDDAVAHVEHFLSLGARDALCLGCDLDGAAVPHELRDLSRLPALAEALLRRNHSESLVHALFFDNAYKFAKKHLKK